MQYIVDAALVPSVCVQNTYIRVLRLLYRSATTTQARVYNVHYVKQVYNTLLGLVVSKGLSE